MEWHVTDAESLMIIDQEVGKHELSPAEYEVVRRVIYATADFEYLHLIRFGNEALQAGAAALAARTTIVVDEPMVQVGIAWAVQNTFSNPIYCSSEAITRPQRDKTRSAWGLETLAQRYPEAIFVIGQSQTALSTLVELIRKKEVAPALVIATPAGFVNVVQAKQELADSMVPHIRTEGRKGGPAVAAAVLDGLLDLAWHAYVRVSSADYPGKSAVS
ncbi:precorrin-8X methylmutase [Thermostichus sp. MS-CIW-28]|jgi:precorrin-8X methylmutase (EC 5.4.1.2)